MRKTLILGGTGGGAARPGAAATGGGLLSRLMGAGRRAFGAVRGGIGNLVNAIRRR